MFEYLVAMSWIMDEAKRALFVTLEWLLQQKSLLRKVAYVCGKRIHHLESELLILSGEIFFLF